jgi:hypothetical protein
MNYYTGFLFLGFFIFILILGVAGALLIDFILLPIFEKLRGYGDGHAPVALTILIVCAAIMFIVGALSGVGK